VGDALFADSPLPIGDKDGMQALPGTWLWEFAENESISKRDAEATKAYLSQSQDKYRPSFGRHTITVPRQTCFASTTNDAQTLNDPTGARRFLPVVVGVVDVDAIERDRVQLLGEAARRVLNGENHWPTDAETEALAAVRDEHRAPDPWEEPIAAWLANPKGNASKPIELMALFGTVTTGDRSQVAGPLPMAAASVGKREQNRAAAVLRRLGWERRRERQGTRRDTYLWHLGSGAQVGLTSR
jgi:predicted P-loop ATPase